MKVCHITNTLRLDGTGITNVVIDLAAALADTGHRVSVLCNVSDADTVELLQRHRVEVVQGIDASSPWGLVKASLGVRRLVRSCDVVHVHTVRATMVALLAAPLHFLRRSVATLHNPYQRSVPVMYLSRAVVSISRVDAAHVRRRSLGLRTPAVVLNGLLGTPRLPHAHEVTAASLKGRPVVFVGALYHRKGVDVLLRAMTTVLERVPDAHLYLVGNRDNPDIEQFSHDLGLDRSVTFVGFLRDPRSFMKSAAVFVLPSRAEGFGNVLTEARSVGAPIVASRVGGIPEALDGGRAGVLVEPDEPEQLSSAIIEILLNHDRSADLRRRAAARLEPFTLAAAAESYLRVYAGLLGRPTP